MDPGMFTMASEEVSSLSRSVFPLVGRTQLSASPTYCAFPTFSSNPISLRAHSWGAIGAGVSSHLCFSYWSVYQESVQPDVSGQRASPTVAGGQTGAKPAASAGVATRKGGADARTFFSRIKWETKWGKEILFFQQPGNSHSPCVGRQWKSSLYIPGDEFYAQNKHRISSQNLIGAWWSLLPVTGLHSICKII